MPTFSYCDCSSLDWVISCSGVCFLNYSFLELPIERPLWSWGDSCYIFYCYLYWVNYFIDTSLLFWWTVSSRLFWDCWFCCLFTSPLVFIYDIRFRLLLLEYTELLWEKFLLILPITGVFIADDLSYTLFPSKNDLPFNEFSTYSLIFFICSIASGPVRVYFFNKNYYPLSPDPISTSPSLSSSISSSNISSASLPSPYS